MFAKAVRVGSIAGLEIKLDWSVLVIFWLLTWSLAAGGLPNLATGYETAAYWVAAVVTTAAFFGSLLAHELSHCVVARRQGIHVRDVTLWLLGGVSVLEAEPATPSADLRIAIAGPAMSLGLGFASLAAAAVFAAAGASNLVYACAIWLGSVNIILAVFNIVPAAPLDGGRVLRAIRWRQTGDRTRAAIDAARAGRAFAFALIALGFAELLFGAEISGIWLILLGWFLLSASHTEEVQARLTHDLGTTRIRELMTPDPITVPDALSVHDVLHDYVLARHCSSFPVLDAQGRCDGLVTLGRMRSVASGLRTTTPVAVVSWPLDEITIATPEELVLDVLRRSKPGGGGRVLVLDRGSVVGIVSPTDITRALQAVEVPAML